MNAFITLRLEDKVLIISPHSIAQYVERTPHVQEGSPPGHTKMVLVAHLLDIHYY